MLSAIVLAAGLSTRMGTENKLLLHYQNKTVITTVVETLVRAGIQEIIVVTGHEAEEVSHALTNLPVKPVYNAQFATGMTTSIQEGIKAAEGTGYMICLCDMVTITVEEYQYLENAFEKNWSLNKRCICMPTYRNETGNPVIFSAFYRNAILDNQQLEGCKNIVQSNKKHLCFVEMNTDHVLQDFDYPREYQQLVAGK